jgi:hypothetical protein
MKNQLNQVLKRNLSGKIERGEAVAVTGKPSLPTTENQLHQFYLDWVNNFGTVARCAEHYGTTREVAEALITAGRVVHERGVSNEALKILPHLALEAELYSLEPKAVGAYQKLEHRISEARKILGNPPPVRHFTVVAVSSNANSFGYKGFLVVAEDGTGYECQFQAYGNDPTPKRGDVIAEDKLPTYPARRELPKSKPATVKKVIAKLKGGAA